jgi:hypothetical protein
MDRIGITLLVRPTEDGHMEVCIKGSHGEHDHAVLDGRNCIALGLGDSGKALHITLIEIATSACIAGTTLPH